MEGKWEGGREGEGRGREGGREGGRRMNGTKCVSSEGYLFSISCLKSSFFESISLLLTLLQLLFQ